MQPHLAILSLTVALGGLTSCSTTGGTAAPEFRGNMHDAATQWLASGASIRAGRHTAEVVNRTERPIVVGIVNRVTPRDLEAFKRLWGAGNLPKGYKPLPIEPVSPSKPQTLQVNQGVRFDLGVNEMLFRLSVQSHRPDGTFSPVDCVKVEREGRVSGAGGTGRFVCTGRGGAIAIATFKIQ